MAEETKKIIEETENDLKEIKDNSKETENDNVETKKRTEICFWCGKPKHIEEGAEITEEIYKNAVVNNYVPCDACSKTFGDGIHVIGVKREPIVKGMFPISKDSEGDLFPTGSMFVANESFIKDMLSEEEDKELLENVLQEKILMLKDEVVTEIIEEARRQNQGEDLPVGISNNDKKES